MSTWLSDGDLHRWNIVAEVRRLAVSEANDSNCTEPKSMRPHLDRRYPHREMGVASP